MAIQSNPVRSGSVPKPSRTGSFPKPMRTGSWPKLRLIRAGSLPKPHKPVRKLLAIGIAYSGEGKLSFTHRDARAWCEFMIKKYKYRWEDITLMLDDETIPKHLWPTEENIREQLRKLVEGARAGDRFMLYYSGHTRQFETTSRLEVDGFDEAIMPYTPPGQQATHIIDDDLRKILVEPLPVDATLMAIFDSCHSGTLLDLGHDRCNRAERHDKGSPQASSGSLTGSSTVNEEPEPLIPDIDGATVCGSKNDGPQAPLGVPTGRMPDGSVFRRTTLNGEVPLDSTQRRKIEIVGVSATDVPAQSARDKKPCAARQRTLNFLDMKNALTSQQEFEICDGNCTPFRVNTRAKVWSLSACQDIQETYEGSKGTTMTKVLIEELSKEGKSHPVLFRLILDVGQILIEPLLKAKEKKTKKWEERGSIPEEKPTFMRHGLELSLCSQDPLASGTRFYP